MIPLSKQAGKLKLYLNGKPTLSSTDSSSQVRFYLESDKSQCGVGLDHTSQCVMSYMFNDRKSLSVMVSTANPNSIHCRLYVLRHKHVWLNKC